MVLFGGIVGLSLFTVSYAEATSYLSDDPDACRNCHVMNDVHDAWARGPHHAVATCNDCHIPHDVPGQVHRQGDERLEPQPGVHAGELPGADPDHAANKTVALANCLYCHGDFVSLVNHEGQAELEDCTRCHASIGHDEIGVGKP